MEVFDSPRSRGPYGIAATPPGTIYYVSLAGSYVGLVAPDGAVTVHDPPTEDQGARRVWSDSGGGIWVSQRNSGQQSRYDPATEEWSLWPLPGPSPQAYAVHVDETDIVCVSDFGGNAIHRFDPAPQRRSSPSTCPQTRATSLRSSAGPERYGAERLLQINSW
jgi:virginiamycin B lyase